MSSRVYVVKCPDYEQAEAGVIKLLEMMGGMAQLVAPRERIVLKPNLLAAAAPEQAVTTHPTVVAAIGRMVKQAGASPIVAESPGSGFSYSERTLSRIYGVCGITEAARQAGIGVNLDPAYEAVSFPQGRLIKRFEIIKPVATADAVFNLCKLKTHTYMGMTGAVKNSFGTIPGRSKPGYHAKLRDKDRFAGMLLDLSACVNPRLSVMDAIVALEGDGPNIAGTPRHVGLLLAAQNPLALDVVAGEIIGLPLEGNPLLLEAERRGLHPTRLEQVDIVGAKMADLRVSDYALPTSVSEGGGLSSMNWWQRALRPFFRDGLTLRPWIVEERCVACGACRDACPVHAITIVDGGRRHAQIDDRDCIRCYCCHEMCPEGAIELRSSLLYRLANQ